MPSCPGGSEPKPTSPAEVWVTADMLRTALGATVSAKLPPPTFQFAQQLYNVPALCEFAPPDPPPITDGQILFAQSNPISWLGLMNAVGMWRDAWAFSTYCQCKVVPPSLCRTFDSGLIHVVGGSHANPTLGAITGVVSGDMAYTTTNYTGGGGHQMEFVLWTDGPTGSWATPYVTSGTIVAGNISGSLSGPLNSSQTHFGVWAGAGGIPVGSSFDVRMTGNLYCGGTPATPTTPPPPPDLPNTPPLPTPSACTTDDLCRRLDALQNGVAQLHDLVGLLQRYRLPFGYNEALETTDIVGSGNISISRLLGIELYVIATIPGGLNLPGNPPYLWDRGWCSINNADGMLRELRVTRDGQVWMPPEMPLATSFNWSLPPGVVMTVRQIKPEP